ncbi:hypothetical protein AgCh_024095 [Apium graveolens]
MKDWPRPKSVKSLRGFLGLTGYYRRFIKGYGILSKPLTQLLKRGQFTWNNEAENAFIQLKEVMSNTHVLAVPDFSKPLVIETDACNTGIGAVMMQNGQPIAFLSKALGPKHLGLSTYKKELLAVIIATQKWRSYLLGHHFIIRTDQEALKYLMEQKITIGLQQRWLSKLMGFDYSVLYKRGKENIVADALSSVVQDTAAQQLITELTINPAVVSGFSLSQGDLMKDGLKTDVSNFIKECTICQRNKVDHIHPLGFLQPIAIPEGAWESISLDFVEGLPKSKGKDTILVVVDRFTKYCHLIPLSHPYTASKVAQEVLDNVIKLHGLPQVIISDRDPIFISSFWKELFTSMGTKIKLSSAYHPQTDGQTERVNQCIEMFLRCIAGHKPTSWASWLSLAEWWYDTSHHSAINMSPYQALYAAPPPSVNFSFSRTKDVQVNDLLRERRDTQ